MAAHSGQVSLFLPGHLSAKVRNTGYIIASFMNPSLPQTCAECEARGHMRWRQTSLCSRGACLLIEGDREMKDVSPRETVLDEWLSSWVGFPDGTSGGEPACSARDVGSVPGLGRPLEEGRATHSSILAWRIPWTEEPRGLQSMGSESDATEHTHTHTQTEDNIRVTRVILFHSKKTLSSLKISLYLSENLISWGSMCI